MKEKIKSFKEKIIIKFKNKEQIKKVIPVLLVIMILIALGLLLFTMLKNNTKLTDLEKIKINEISDKYMSYIDDVEDVTSKDNDRYILYALDYAYYEEGKDTLTTGELRKIINSIFNKNLKDEEIISIGITPVMNERSIIYDGEKNTYSIIKNKKSYAEIATEKIVRYEIKEIKKKKNKYIVKYNKYVVTNPYEIVNYYNEKNEDTKEINEYLSGNISKNKILKYINKENISKIGKKESEVSITYIIKDNKILIDNIS